MSNYLRDLAVDSPNNNKDIVEAYINNPLKNAYMLTIARDGEEPVRSIYFYDNAIEASEAYSRYSDWGFAKEYLTVELYEPLNNKKHTKILKRPKGGECVFVRQDYIDIANIIKKREGFFNWKQYKEFVIEFALLFSKDNQRFDSNRFFENCGFDIENFNLE